MNPTPTNNNGATDVAAPTAPTTEANKASVPLNANGVNALVAAFGKEPRWMAWQFVGNEKKPISPVTGYSASCSDPATWTDYETAAAYVKANNLSSIGFALTNAAGFSPVTCIDWDHVVGAGGDMPSFVRDAVESLDDSYTEPSASGEGFHTLVYGSTDNVVGKEMKPSPPTGTRKVEIFSHNKMFALTLRPLPGLTEIQHANGNLTAICEKAKQGIFNGIVAERFDAAKLKAVLADAWAAYNFDSRSAAVQSALVLLAFKHDYDAENIREEFEASAICAAWEAKGKWSRLGNKEIQKAIEKAREFALSKPANILVDEPVVELPKDSVPRLELARHDCIDLLAEELTAGTIIPFNYAREQLKACLLASLRNRPVLPWHKDLHTRQYVILVSPHPESGKGESYKRVVDALTAEVLIPGDEEAPFTGETALAANRLEFIDGSMLGSPEYAVRAFGGIKADDHSPQAEQARERMGRLAHIVNYDEGMKLFQKDSAGEGGRGLVTMFTTLYELNRHTAGSIKNNTYVVDSANVSLFLAFTQESFHKALGGSGNVRDGFLSRCVIVADTKNQVAGDWRQVDEDRVKELLPQLLAYRQRTDLPEESAATDARHAFQQYLTQIDPFFAARLRTLFTQDLYARALFSPEGRITVETVERARKWAEHQFLARQVLWPADVSKDRVETMTALLRRAYETHPALTHRQAKKFANVHRPGSGGEFAYMRAHQALLASGTIRQAGISRKGTPVFEAAQ